MDDRTFLLILVGLGIVAFAVGIWIGLGYPGLRDRGEATGSKAPRMTPYRQLLTLFGRGARTRRGDRSGGRGAGSGRWGRR